MEIIPSFAWFQCLFYLIAKFELNYVSLLKLDNFKGNFGPLIEFHATQKIVFRMF